MICNKIRIGTRYLLSTIVFHVLPNQIYLGTSLYFRLPIVNICRTHVPIYNLIEYKKPSVFEYFKFDYKLNNFHDRHLLNFNDLSIYSCTWRHLIFSVSIHPRILQFKPTLIYANNFKSLNVLRLMFKIVNLLDRICIFVCKRMLKITHPIGTLYIQYNTRSTFNL